MDLYNTKTNYHTLIYSLSQLFVKVKGSIADVIKVVTVSWKKRNTFEIRRDTYKHIYPV